LAPWVAQHQMSVSVPVCISKVGWLERQLHRDAITPNLLGLASLGSATQIGL